MRRSSTGDRLHLLWMQMTANDVANQNRAGSKHGQQPCRGFWDWHDSTLSTLGRKRRLKGESQNRRM